ncbi:unnamed protein product [Ilex paraguariensis]|uniref:Mei2-like C-terminal RNA recognition motif domain-containing protein n=1 Tax=Ilex paraguariensis TaxID=185542 RepID=A0ABC8U8W5_9AQUA
MKFEIFDILSVHQLPTLLQVPGPVHTVNASYVVSSNIGIIISGNWPHFGSPVEHNSLQGFSRSPGLGSLSPMNSNHLPGLASILSPHVSNPAKIAPIGKDQLRKLSSSPRPVSSFGESNSNSSGTGMLSGPQFLWGSPTLYSEHANSSAWPTSSVGHPVTSTGQGQGYSYSSRQGSFLGSPHHHHVGSAPTGVALDRHFGYFPESPESSFMSPVAFGSGGLSSINGNAINMGARGAINVGVALPGHMNEIGSPGSRMISLPRNNPILFGNGPYQGMGAFINEGLIERRQSRRIEYSGNQIDNKKQYQLDLDKIISGDDTRTTLMIKNIPNKYTSKMLLAAIDENHRGTYDFLYLPIDFKNKCNVGYAFINMMSPSHIISFYEAFNGKKWEKFNSEKVASLAYARIQGKAALVTHFQNSSLMNEDKRCRPILFQSEGPEIIDQEPLLSNNLNVCIRQPDGSYSGDSLESPKGDVEEKREII